MKEISKIRVCILGVIFLFGCETSNYPLGTFELEERIVRIPEIGFNGLQYTIPDGYGFSSTIMGVPNEAREWYEKEVADLNESVGLDYHFYNPSFIFAENKYILLSPVLIKQFYGQFGNQPKTHREDFLNYFMKRARISLIGRAGFDSWVETNDKNLTVGYITNANMNHSIVYEERMVLGTLREIYVIFSIAPLAHREDLKADLEALINSIKL